jgi:hypothetical protein
MKNMSDYEKIGYHIKGAILDSFCDYGGAPNVVDGLMAIAKAIDHLAEVLKAVRVGGVK